MSFRTGTGLGGDGADAEVRGRGAQHQAVPGEDQNIQRGESTNVPENWVQRDWQE